MRLTMQLVHGAVDDGMDVVPEEHADVGPAQGLQRAAAHGPVLLYIAQQLQQALLPQQGPVVLPQQGHRLLLEHPAHQVIDILKVIVKGLTFQAAVVGQLPDGDFIQGLLDHFFLQRLAQHGLGVFRHSVWHGSHRLLRHYSMGRKIIQSFLCVKILTRQAGLQTVFLPDLPL